MENKTIFKNYYSRLKREGIVKAALCGIIAGFAIDFIIALIAWFTVFNGGLYIAIGAGIAVGVSTAFITYYVKFRPTTQDIARRIDSLGLEERLITMTELENDPSFIAMKQREDAKENLGKFDMSKIRISVAKPLIAVAIIIGVFGLSMTTVNVLTEFGIIPPASVIFPSGPVEEDFVTIEYFIIDGEGEIKGEVVQIVKKGENGETVIAEPAEGWAFVSWDDDIENPERQELNVTKDMTISGMFIEVDEEDDGEGEGDDQGKPDPNDQNEQNNSSGKNPIYEPSNHIIDGETAYQHEYDNFYQQMMEEIASNPNLAPKERKALESYFETLKTSDWVDDEEEED